MSSDAASNFSCNLFWDADTSLMDLEKHSVSIIDRVVTRGTFNDWLFIKSIYGIERIKETCLKIRYLDPKTHHSLANVFEIPRESFRCHAMRELNKGLWIY